MIALRIHGSKPPQYVKISLNLFILWGTMVIECASIVLYNYITFYGGFMKKGAYFFIILCMFSLSVSAQEESQEAPSGEYTGVEIENTIAAVKAANPGDYILFKSGKRYVLTKEEIDIVRGNFDYDDLSDVNTVYQEDGTEIKTISEAHVVYAYPDGQSTHLLKTGASFTSYLKYIEKKYQIALYVDYFQDLHDSAPVKPPSFDVFRAAVVIQTISNGINEMQGVTITAYNYKGENFLMKYCSEPDMYWGFISEEGSYKPTGESRQIDFDIE